MRSFAFSIAYWFLSIAYGLTAAFAALAPGRDATAWVIRRYVKRMVQAMRIFAGIRIEVRGTVWLEPETGRKVKTEASIGAASNTATTLTMFAQDGGLGLTVPVEMQTSWMYKDRPVNGVAKYGEFRRFAVRTETQVQPSAQP